MNDENFEQRSFKFSKNRELELWVPKKLHFFSPNTVTAAIADNIPIHQGAIIASAGSGIGALEILLAQRAQEERINIGHIYTTEIAPQQVESAIMNMEFYNLQYMVTPLQGDILQPIIDNEFINPTMIVGDCSALTDIGIELGWYPKLTGDTIHDIPLGGEDGTEVVTRFLKQASEYQCPTYFAIAQNFSNGQKIRDVADKCFGQGAIRCLNRERIPLPEKQMTLIEKTKTTIYKPIERKRTRGFWILDIFEARGVHTTGTYHPNPEF